MANPAICRSCPELVEIMPPEYDGEVLVFRGLVDCRVCGAMGWEDPVGSGCIFAAQQAVTEEFCRKMDELPVGETEDEQ